MKAPDQIIQLVESFHQQIELYRSGGMNETQTRIQFIDPFFEALGWDVRNEKQTIGIYQDVIHEDSLKISDANKAKAPDYSFRVAGVRKFFVEAKKPAVNVGKSITAAFQVRRYGWYGESVRKLITDGKYLEKIVHFGDQQIFPKVSTYTCLLFLAKLEQSNLEMEKVTDLIDWIKNNNSQKGIIDYSLFSAKEWNFILGEDANLFSKLKQIKSTLENVTDRIFQGIKTSADKIYIVEKISHQDNLIQVFSKQNQRTYWLESNLLHPLIKGGDSKRYYLSKTNKLIIFPYMLKNNGSMELISMNTFEREYPLTWNYLLDNKNYLESRENNKMLKDKWYGYVYPKALDIMALPKIFTPDIATGSSFTWDKTGEIFFTGGVAGGYGILVKSNYSWEYILGLLNSKVLEFYLKKSSTSMRGGYYSFESRFIRNLPIKIIDNSQIVEKQKHDLIVNLVQQMLSLHEKLHEVNTPPAKRMIQQQIQATDRQINQLVYELYELTNEEIAIVEGI